MRNRVGATVSIATCLLFLALLAWPYTVRSVYAINTYYGSGALNPLFAGVLAVGVLVVFAAVRKRYISAALGAGSVFGFSLIIFLVIVAWAVTVRVDVFRAPGWILPAQRFVLVGLSGLMLVGTGWYVWTNGRLSLRR